MGLNCAVRFKIFHTMIPVVIILLGLIIVTATDKADS